MSAEDARQGRRTDHQTRRAHPTPHARDLIAEAPRPKDAGTTAKLHTQFGLIANSQHLSRLTGAHRSSGGRVTGSRRQMLNMSSFNFDDAAFLTPERRWANLA